MPLPTFACLHTAQCDKYTLKKKTWAPPQGAAKALLQLLFWLVARLVTAITIAGHLPDIPFTDTYMSWSKKQAALAKSMIRMARSYIAPFAECAFSVRLLWHGSLHDCCT